MFLLISLSLSLSLSLSGVACDTLFPSSVPKNKGNLNIAQEFIQVSYIFFRALNYYTSQSE